jgi:hypothetical protein
MMLSGESLGLHTTQHITSTQAANVPMQARNTSQAAKTKTYRNEPHVQHIFRHYSLPNEKTLPAFL